MTNPYNLNLTSTPAEVRAAWADALESGDYPQCTRHLAEQESILLPEGQAVIVRELYCALGVLQQLAYDAGVTTLSPAAATLRSQTSLSLKVARWAAISVNGRLHTPVPNPDRPGSFVSIMALNDYGLWDFHQLAKEIRNGNLQTPTT